MSQGRNGSGKVALDVLPVEDNMKKEPQQEMVRMAAAMLHCHACNLPLKQPIFKCNADHLVCSSCRGVHGEACGRPVRHSTLAEAFAAAAFVSCDYKSYGCDPGNIVYHEAADHRLLCQHAPCGCPERCGFSGSWQKLLKHISGPDHSRRIIVVHYGKPWVLSLALSQGWQVLVGEEEKDDPHRKVFLVSLGDSGAEVDVSLVYIHAHADVGIPSEFSYKIAVQHLDDGTRHFGVAGDEEQLTIQRDTGAGRGEVLGGEEGVSVRRHSHPQHPNRQARTSSWFYSPFGSKPPPYSPTRPFSPKSPPFSPTRPFSPMPSPKRPTSPKFSVASPLPSVEGKS